MAGLGALFGEGSSASTFLLWVVASAFAQALLAPDLDGLQQFVWRQTPERAISPADLADMVIRNILTYDDAANQAANSGYSGEAFNNMVLDTGEPVGLELALEMFRRQIIPLGTGAPGEASLLAMIATSRLRPEWAQAIQAAAEVPISAADAVEAVLRGQIDQPSGETEAYATGINADRFQILLDTAGRPPGLGELLELKRRGLIPDMGLGPTEVTFQQGIAEGDTKDKWLAQYLELADYIPPPRSIATLQSHGVIDTATAAGLYQANGLTPALAGIYAASAVAVRVAGNRELTEAAILKLYYDQLVDGPGATGMLANLGYDAATSAFLLELQDFQRAATFYEGAVTVVGRLYTTRKVNRAATVAALAALDVPAAAAAQRMAIWDTEVAAEVKTLSAAQIEGAFAYGVQDQAWAQAALEDLGYTPHDAWVALSVRAHGPLPDEPPAGPLSGLGVTTTAGDDL